MLRAQARSCRQPKAVRPISTAGKSAVARFTKRESGPLTLVGVTDSATAEFAQFFTKSLLNLRGVMVSMQICVDFVFQSPCGRAMWPSAWRG